MIDSQVGQVEGICSLPEKQSFPWLDSHDYGAICYVEPWVVHPDMI